MYRTDMREKRKKKNVLVQRIVYVGYNKHSEIMVCLKSL